MPFLFAGRVDRSNIPSCVLPTFTNSFNVPNPYFVDEKGGAAKTTQPSVGGEQFKPSDDLVGRMFQAQSLRPFPSSSVVFFASPVGLLLARHGTPTPRKVLDLRAALPTDVFRPVADPLSIGSPVSTPFPDPPANGHPARTGQTPAFGKAGSSAGMSLRKLIWY